MRGVRKKIGGKGNKRQLWEKELENETILVPKGLPGIRGGKGHPEQDGVGKTKEKKKERPRRGRSQIEKN